MFEYIKQIDQPNFMARFTSLLVSIAVHATIIGVLIAVPLLFCNSLPTQELLTILLVTPPLPPEPLPPSPPLPRNPGARSKVITIDGNVNLRLPQTQDEMPPISTEDPFDSSDFGIAVGGAPGPVGYSGGIATGIPGNFSDRVRFTVSEPPALPKPPVPKSPHAPVPVVGTLQSSKLIVQIKPEYPKPAQAAHVTGKVTLQAIIDEEGNVTQLKVMSGHPLLTQAAIQAVSQWKYSPTILNGEPVPVIATVTVNFSFK